MVYSKERPFRHFRHRKALKKSGKGTFFLWSKQEPGEAIDSTTNKNVKKNLAN